MGSPISYGKFRDIAHSRGLETRERHEHHWQVKANGVTVNVWPRTSGEVKYLLQGEPAGQKARIGTIDDAMNLCMQKASALSTNRVAHTPPADQVNGAPKASPDGVAALAKATNMDPGIRNRATIMMDESGAFIVVSHGDAVEHLAFDEMLGMVVNIFHSPKQKGRAETLFAGEKSHHRRRPREAELPV